MAKSDTRAFLVLAVAVAFSAADATSTPTPAPTPAICDKQPGWCIHTGAVSEPARCGGKAGHYCSDSDGNSGFMACGGSVSSWPTGSCRTCTKLTDTRSAHRGNAITAGGVAPGDSGLTFDECAAACEAEPGCMQAVFSKSNGACYPMSGAESGNDSKDGFPNGEWMSVQCFDAPSGACTTLPDTRSTYRSSHVDAVGMPYGAVTTIDECIAACKATPACMQAVFGKSSGACYPMSCAESTGQVGSAGGDGWTSVHCNHAATAASKQVVVAGGAPTCEIDATGATHVYYSSAEHPSFKCIHTGSTCTCVANHPTHHAGGCMQMEGKRSASTPTVCDKDPGWCTHAGSHSVPTTCGGKTGHYCSDSSGASGFMPCDGSAASWPIASCVPSHLHLLDMGGDCTESGLSPVPLTWASSHLAKMTCSGGKETSAPISSPGGTISVTSNGWAPGCYTTNTIPSATSNWQGVQFRLASTAGYFLAGLGNSNYPMHSGSALKYGLFSLEFHGGGSKLNIYTAGNFNGVSTIAGYCNGFDCDYSGSNGPMTGWSGGDTVGIMFRLAGGGLEIQYQKNGVGFRTLNTANLKTSANNPNFTSIFPLRFDTASYSGSGAAMDDIQLIVD